MPHSGWITRIIVGVATLLALAAALHAETWRVAGTLNDWNLADDDWALEPDPARPGTLILERRIQPGEYRFKFVLDGAWSNGHLGAADTPRCLEQPGRDIRLSVPADAKYRISLDPTARTWAFDAIDLSAPIPDIVIRGVPTLGRMFEIDMRRSLTNNPPELCQNAAMTIAGSFFRTRRAVDNSHRYGAIAGDPGALPLKITFFDGRGEDATSIIIERTLLVLPRYFFDMEFVGDSGEVIKPAEPGIIIRPYADGLFRAIVDIPEPGVMKTATVMIQGKADDTVVVRNQGRIEPGRYVVEIRNGIVRRHNDRDVSPSIMIPGNWTTFDLAFEPSVLPPDEVFLTGDFNNWARPGHPDAIRLTNRIEGKFDAVLDLAPGAYRYRFVYDGADHLDPAALATADGPDAEPASVVVVGETPDDYDPPKPNHINTDAVAHLPLSTQFVSPISRSLGLADISVTTLPGDADEVTLVLEPLSDIPERMPMRRTRDLAGFDRWTVRVRTGLSSFAYRFEIRDAETVHRTEAVETFLRPDPLAIPDWAKGAVWYQIFAERFRNGNPDNDPRGEGTHLMEWDADWYDVTPEEADAWRERYDHPEGEPFPERTGGPLFHVVWDRRYGGDLQGVVEKLDELAELGVTVIYFNPVFEADSMHKYDATDFRHIDDNFAAPGPVPEEWTVPEGETLDPATWTWTEADRYFLEVLLPKARARGIRVVLDAVFNHTGRDFFAFKDVLENGRSSPYSNWYYVKFDEDGKVASWTAWDGPSGWLPKFRQTPDGDLVAPVKEHLFEVTRRWMDPDGDGNPIDGIDGWRLDVPLDIGGSKGAPFWSDWRKLVKSINPNAVIVAEIWNEEEATPFLQGQHFDTHMHYPFAMSVTEWLAVKPGMTAQQLGNQLRAAFDEPPQTNLIHQNLFGSHDTDRYVSKLLNPGREYDAGNRIQDGDDYNDTRPPDHIYKLSLVGVAIQATYLGAPMIYYGDEYGMWGADDPTDRKPLPWPDTGSNKNPDDNIVPGIRDAYAEWFGLRKDPIFGPILRFGDVRHIDTGDPGVFAFARALNGFTVYVVANRNDSSFDASSILPDAFEDTDVEPVSARCWLEQPE